MKKLIPFLIALVSLSSCVNDVDEIFHSEIDPELQPYVYRFFEEAKIRGVHLKHRNLKVKFASLPVNGRTYLITNTIVIDRESDLYKVRPEELIFHELGHLYLKRNHDNSSFGLYGYAKSIMAINNAAGYEQKTMEYKRKYYVDELFNPSTENPYWAFMAPSL